MKEKLDYLCTTVCTMYNISHAHTKLAHELSSTVWEITRFGRIPTRKTMKAFHGVEQEVPVEKVNFAGANKV